MILTNKVNIEPFIGTIQARNFSPAHSRRAPMFLFNRSGFAVCLALAVAAFPVLIQFF
jgi:hypothetical protein